MSDSDKFSNSRTAVYLRNQRKIVRDLENRRMYKDYSHEEKMEMGKYRLKTTNAKCMEKYGISIFYMKKINKYYKENI